MKKIPSLFQRNYDGDWLVRDELVPGSEWVANGEGTATRKWDGASCMVQGGKLFKRYDAKNGKRPPEGFIPAQEPDQKTGHWPGWVPVTDKPEDRWHLEAFRGGAFHDGTYELCGPNVRGNPEWFAAHVLIRHGAHVYNAPRTFSELRDWFAGPGSEIEGIVWHHEDGRMVKIKRKDFGYARRGDQQRKTDKQYL